MRLRGGDELGVARERLRDRGAERFVDRARREPQRGRDRERARAAVTDPRHAVDAEQRCGAVGVGVHDAAQACERGLEQQRAELAAQIGDHRLLEPRADHATGGFGDLERDVAGEAVGDHDVEVAVEDAFTLGVAGVDEVGALAGREQLVRGAGEIGALAVLAAVAQQADLRALAAVLEAGIAGAHDRELHEVDRTTLDVRTDVEQRGEAVRVGQARDDRRAIDAFQSAILEEATRQHRARVARAHRRIGTAGAHELEAGRHRRIRLGAHGLAGVIVHRDALRRVMDRQRKIFVIGGLRELGFDRIAIADEHDVHATTRGLDRTGHLVVRTVIAAQRVERDPCGGQGRTYSCATSTT
ncbi:MAG TPA: hypothetical protein VG755_17870 [Nannocystaceae bacterium]|nr:hypothetical protein [Nannocystaceae bacterium]